MTEGVLAGLSAVEAAARLVRDGPNELPQAHRRTVLHVALDVLREPMLALLIAGGVAYLALGDRIEALVLLAFATFSVAITIIQELRTEHVLDALRALSSPRALVIRDGRRTSIAGREVVCGDLVILEQGDRIAADACLIESVELQTDESLLTGESLPVSKVAATDGSKAQPGGEDSRNVYAGSLVSRGSGIARVFATGERSAFGKIGLSLAVLDSEAPRLRTQIARLVTWCGLGGGAVALAVVILNGVLRGNWIEAILAGIAIGMSMLPEEFPVVLTIFLAMGAWRIGRVGVLTRRAAAIETLGSATVLCVDKTGTLTENRMSVTDLWLPSGETASVTVGDVPRGPFRSLLETAVLASAAHPSDPMEDALHRALDVAGKIASTSSELLHTYMLCPGLLAMSNVREEEGRLIISAKGAPEAIASLCKLKDMEASRLTQAVDTMARRGARVIAIATARAPDRRWHASQKDYVYTLSGLVGLADPIRPSVPAAVAECRAAGIRVVMVTGDYAATARSIAAQAGIADGEVLTGTDFAALDDAQLALRLKTVTVFARITPDQKLRLVQAFKADGEIVAMTGDGVNDAPSLKAAHIGVAMGRRGTDVAREASAIVLLEDDFGAIVQAIRLGRRIYDNIRKAMAFIFAVHVPIAGLALLPLLLGMPVLLWPVHIALLELIIDPMCALVFEAECEEADIMRRPPRDPTEALFPVPMIVWSIFQGGLALAILAAMFLIATWTGMPANEIRGLIFFSLVADIIVLVLVDRSFGTSVGTGLVRRNPALRYIIATVAAATLLILVIPGAGHLLRFGDTSWWEMALVLGLAGLLATLLEGGKQLVRPAWAARAGNIRHEAGVVR